MTIREQYDALFDERAGHCEAESHYRTRQQWAKSKAAAAQYNEIQAQIDAMEAAHPELKAEDDAATSARVDRAIAID